VCLSLSVCARWWRLQIVLSQKLREGLVMHRSELSVAATRSITNDLLSQPFQLLSGLDIVGNTSSLLADVSKSVAALSMDKTFIRSRQKQVRTPGSTMQPREARA